VSDIPLDAWSLTSVTCKLPGRPEVAEYLHGLTNDPPETYVAWRKEIGLLSAAAVDAATLEDWFLACPILSYERLRDQTDRVKNTLASLLDAHQKSVCDRDYRVAVLNERGEAEWRSLSEIVQRNFRLGAVRCRWRRRQYRTIVLPVEAGGLNGGWRPRQQGCQ
jgi:CRISPR-associated endonuclease/helicase Cas3